MDLSFLEHLIPNLAAYFNVQPSTVLLLVTILVTACNLIGRVIPDDKTGVLGMIRDVCKLLGVYAPNRVTSGISVNDVARSVVSQADNSVLAAAESPDSLIPEIMQDRDARQQVVPAFPGLQECSARDPKTGRFVKREEGESI